MLFLLFLRLIRLAFTRILLIVASFFVGFLVGVRLFAFLSGIILVRLTGLLVVRFLAVLFWCGRLVFRCSAIRLLIAFGIDHGNPLPTADRPTGHRFSIVFRLDPIFDAVARLQSQLGRLKHISPGKFARPRQLRLRSIEQWRNQQTSFLTLRPYSHRSQPVVGIFGLHLNGQFPMDRYRHIVLLRLNDLNLRRQVANHVDAMPDRLRIFASLKIDEANLIRIVFGQRGILGIQP